MIIMHGFLSGCINDIPHCIINSNMLRIKYSFSLYSLFTFLSVCFFVYLLAFVLSMYFLASTFKITSCMFNVLPVCIIYILKILCVLYLDVWLGVKLQVILRAEKEVCVKTRMWPYNVHSFS